jgi:beta-xylosidase
MVSPSNTNPTVHTNGPRVYNRVVVMDPLFDPWDPVIARRPSVQTWQADFEATYGRQPDSIAKYAYDAATLLLARIDQVSQVDGGGNLVLSRAALEAAVRNTFDFEGITGVISLDVYGNRLLTPHTVVQSDPFSQASLDPAWDWIGAEPTQWSLTAVPGFLQITTQDDQANLLVREAPEVDFEIRTYLEFTPTENFQFGGLYLYGDADNFMAFGRAYCDPGIPVCTGNGIYFDHIEGGVMVGSNYATATTLLNAAYLRVVRQGADYTGYVSENGTEWTEIGTHTAGFVPLEVGLIASNATQPVTDIPANFDFFVLQYEAGRTALPLVMR